jgi:hypothetical protein
MAKLSLQFHASRDEVAQLVGQWVNELGLQLAHETLSPAYSAVAATAGPIPGSVDRLVLSLHPIDLDGSGPFGLDETNPDSLTILLGRQTDTTLTLSILQAMTEDPDSLAAWRRIRKSLTTSFHKGVHVVNSMTGAKDSYSHHYFSPGAKQLYDHGVRMADLNDVLIYELP